MFNSGIGARMKQYENCYRFYLTPNSSVIVRLDGRSFHNFTKGFARPYDEVFAHAMWETARQLCENVSGCKFAYTQSDEITLVLNDYGRDVEPWFGNNLQKIVSISASMATYFFKKNFEEAIRDEYLDWYRVGIHNDEKRELLDQHSNAIDNKLCVFDSRAFIIPREEVFNCIYWRQLDCTRNSIQLVGQANFNHKQLQGLSCDEIQEKLFQEKGINWANEPNWFKNGVSIYRIPTEVTHDNVTVTRNKWFIDVNTPVFTTDRNYIEQHI